MGSWASSRRSEYKSRSRSVCQLTSGPGRIVVNDEIIAVNDTPVVIWIP